MIVTQKFIILLAATIAVTSPALAHTGVHTPTTAALSGFLHPLGGIDHVAAMMAVGVLAQRAGDARMWRWPALFVAVMVASALAANAGLVLPLLEPILALTVVASGVLIAAGVKPSVLVGSLVAVFALFHGHAHGLESPALPFPHYIAGFALATAALQLAGIGLGTLIERLPKPLLTTRLMGGATALLGLMLLVRLA